MGGNELGDKWRQRKCRDGTWRFESCRKHRSDNAAGGCFLRRRMPRRGAAAKWDSDDGTGCCDHGRCLDLGRSGLPFLKPRKRHAATTRAVTPAVAPLVVQIFIFLRQGCTARKTGQGGQLRSNLDT